jgi:hypothetical protein
MMFLIRDVPAETNGLSEIPHWKKHCSIIHRDVLLLTLIDLCHCLRSCYLIFMAQQRLKMASSSISVINSKKQCLYVLANVKNGFLDPKNLVIDTKFESLGDLEAEL